ncbi:ankyrin repeat domain-containing protein [Mucilaginibacter mali]|uniref:Ankyrin repeat domain-containing protein n=1 Tax=Mucilaginibacter mali TaxID=2740462 RepID=A0A7D4TXF1_9SPHI|nr:ankyrin repeat domain-containing protein [Mucilaginibacter mali]QKJ32315.1 ankyrin repeat domain-containing protein [Mucilaginibacter mali]
MKTTDITDLIFLQAVNALDAGRLNELQSLVAQHPYLLRDRLITPDEEGYFKDPYLVWFVADNPIRNEKLPSNIVEVTRFLVDAVKREAPDTWQQQLTYTLGLVATGRIPRESGKQIAMMDVLINAGATPGGGMGAIAHGNIDAANHLLDRGGKITLPAAMILGRKADVDRLLNKATGNEKLTALTAAAFYGKADMVKHLLDLGVDPNGYSSQDTGFHSHATPLHQAIYSTSLDAVKLLVEAGASLTATDKAYNGTPLGWAMYMQTETDSEADKAAYARIEAYLKSLNP